MFGRSFRIFQAFGFPIRVDASWIFLAILITWSLAGGVFPQLYAGLPAVTYWLMGIVGAAGLFASIVVHELAHAVVARRFGMHIRGITLFIFGGVAELQDEPPNPRAEFMVAIAGPIASILIAAALGAITAAVAPFAGWPPLFGVLGYLATINAILVVFNLIPAFPLDGGRVLRSALWKWKGDLQRATRISSEIGSGFGIVLIVIGIVSIVGGEFIGGFWWILIGMFLRSAAQMSYQQVLVRRALSGEPVWRFMHRDPHTVPPDVTLSEFVDDYVYRYHHKLFPVTSNGHLYGCVSTRQIREVPREQWPEKRIDDVLQPCTPENTISPNEDAVTALGRLHKTGSSRLIVVDHGQLVGILSLKDLLRFLSLKIELDAGAEADEIEAILSRPDSRP
jgi:Zn-dependent protease